MPSRLASWHPRTPPLLDPPPVCRSVGFIADASKFFFFWLIIMLSMFAMLSFGMMAVRVGAVS